MTEYSYRTVDVKSNLILEDLDLTDVKFQRRLSGIGTLNASLWLPSGSRGRIIDTSTEPGRTGIYVLRDNQPVWGGIIWKKNWNEATSRYDLTCGSWESYLYHVVQTQTFNFTSVDQFQIARRLLADNGVDAEINLDLPLTSAASGFLRDRSMYAYERKTVGLEFEQLAGLQNGFDYRIENYITSAGVLNKRLLLGYPQLGRTYTGDGADLTFSYPGNLQPYKHDTDAENSGWTVYGVGSGEAEATVLAQATDASYRDAGWPRLDLVSPYKTVLVQDTLQSNVNRDLAQLKPSEESLTLQVTATSDLQLGDFAEGDRALFTLSSRRWDQPRRFTAQIALIDVTPSSADALETVALGLINEVRIS